MAMSNQFNNSSNEKESQRLSTQENRGRRLLEMQRRFKSLQAQRFHLRHQLASVDRYLASLESQIKSYESYDHLVLDK